MKKVGDRVIVAKEDEFEPHYCSCVGQVVDVFSRVSVKVKWPCGLLRDNYYYHGHLKKLDGIHLAVRRLK